MKKLLLSLALFTLISCNTGSSINSGNQSHLSSSDTVSSEKNSLFSDYGNKILQAKENVIIAHDKLTSINNTNNLKKRRRIRRAPSTDGLLGEFLIDLPDPEVLSKELTEPCSVAYSVLEALIISGNANKNFSGITYQINQYETNVARIDTFEEENYLFVRYGDYKMLISGKDDDPSVCSFYIQEDKIWMNYVTTQTSLTYWNSSNSWDQEIDALSASLDKYDTNGINGKPIKLIKSVLEKEESIDSWKQNPSKILIEYDYPSPYLQPESLQQLFFGRHNINCGFTDDLIVNNNSLKGFNYLVTPAFLPIPTQVTSISKLESSFKSLYGIYIPESIADIEKGCLNDIVVDYIFMDSLKENTDSILVENLLDGHNETRILYKNQWEYVDNICMPKECHYSLYQTNLAGIDVTDYINKYIYVNQLSSFLTKIEFNEIMNMANKNVEEMLTQMNSSEEIEEQLLNFYNDVVNTLKQKEENKKVEFYYLNENNEKIKIEEIAGEDFIEHEIIIEEKEE